MNNSSQETAGDGFPTDQLDYELPEALIAQEPLADRSASRMLVVERSSRRLTDAGVQSLPDWLTAGDTLVLNDTRVLPAKFALRRATGGVIHALFVAERERGQWDVLLRGANRLREGEELAFVTECEAPLVRTVRRGERGQWRIAVEGGDGCTPASVLAKVGRMPLPPYIKRDPQMDARDAQDRSRYQTVYASKDGAIAAPTAGLHLTDAMLGGLAVKGVAVEHVTLHVGYGTFAPVEAANLADHAMHSESYEMSAETARRLREARSAGGRIVAVGTTSARVLETTWRDSQWAGASSGATDLFCYPPYRLGGVDVLLTNFHLPRSTLIALVMSFAGVELTRRAYTHAVAQAYRFYSYGDAMLIL